MTTQFKVGDQVKITNKWIKWVDNSFENSWSESMDSYISKTNIYIIKNIYPSGIALMNTSYRWPPQSLTLAVPIPIEDQVKQKIAELWNKSNYGSKCPI